MIRVAIEELSALMALTLFLGMIAVWAAILSGA